MTQPTTVKPRERKAIIQSLTSGVVPRIGLQHIQVGRKLEVEALLGDIDTVTDGGAGFRLIVGPFGSGKTFFMHLGKVLAQEQGLVIAHADLTPERRLSGTNGTAQALYQELMRNLSTKSKPDGGALAAIIEKWIAHLDPETDFNESAIRRHLRPLEDLVNGFDFATVIATYVDAYQNIDDQKKSNCIRWLRAEYTNKTEARADLGVRSIIDDQSIYDYLKLWAKFVRMAGYQGLMIVLDEAINLWKIRHPQARERNYETILRMLNDCLQGGAANLMILIGGTPEFLTDHRRGLHSYGALRTRLAANRYATEERRDLSGPVIELPNLTPEDLYVLLMNLRRVHAHDRDHQTFLPDAGIEAFMNSMNQRLGAAFFLTPRDAIVQFVKLLNLLEQHPDMDWTESLQGFVDQASHDTETSVREAEGQVQEANDGLADFKI